MEVPLFVALIAAAGAIVASVVSAGAQRGLRRLENSLEGTKRAVAFRTEQLTLLYLPVSMHLRATRALSTSHYGADDAIAQEVEHALHEHNKAIVDSMLNASMYLEPDAPDAVAVELLAHLLQWETLYGLKYQKKPAFHHPIWEEIRRLNYSKFPDGAAEYFHERSKQIRSELHADLRSPPRRLTPR